MLDSGFKRQDSGEIVSGIQCAFFFKFRIQDSGHIEDCIWHPKFTFLLMLGQDENKGLRG
jgi:hypothetical protein